MLAIRDMMADELSGAGENKQYAGLVQNLVDVTG